MDQETLNLFIRRLARWSEEIIEVGRTPFRKVEVRPPLLTKQGDLSPPLVFWINRESFMAGGVLLLPPRESSECVEEGIACAGALGIGHFATWAPNEIVLWETTGTTAHPVRTLSHNETPTRPEDFRESLRILMEELKILSVTRALPPDSLSAHHLANLCREALRTTRPCLEESARAALGRLDVETPPPIDRLAVEKGGLTLIRLLALLRNDLLPPSVPPEKLEKAMEFAVGSLPPHLLNALKFSSSELPLPLEASVHFHHLLRRLSQIGFGKDFRTGETLEILLACEGGSWGGFPPPSVEGEPPLLLINSDRLPEGEPEMMETASPPLLALCSFLRDLNGCAPSLVSERNPFRLPLSPPPRTIAGTLCDERIPSAAERKALVASLRASWPTRRFPLHPRTPLWAWEFVHFLGLAADGARIRLDAPYDWLTAPYGAPLYDLLRENTSLETMTLLGDRLTIELVKGGDEHSLVTLTGPAGSRRIPWKSLMADHRALLPLALRLTDDLFSLLESGTLAIVQDTFWPTGREREIFLFTRSSAGRRLWSAVSDAASLPPRDRLRQELVRFGFPLPTPAVLEHLTHLSRTEDEKVPLETLDAEIALWTGITPLPLAPSAEERPRVGTRRSPPGKDLAETIAASVFSDGIPRFPEEYLYDYYRPEKTSYDFVPPVIIVDTFLGRVILQDASGTCLEVDGPETARAIRLSTAVIPPPVELPTDRSLTAAITDRYLSDLRRLRGNLLEEVHRRIDDSRKAAKLARSIWSDHPLPPWEMLDE